MILTQLWLLVNLGLTRGIFVNLACNCTSSAPMPKQVALRQFRCFHDPMEKRLYFWNFQGLAYKSRVGKILCLQLPLLYPTSRVGKILCLQLPLLYLTSRVQWEVLDKELDSAFCCPKLHVKTWFCVYFHFFFIFCKYVIAKQIGKHASIYFIFVIFCIYDFFFFFFFYHLCHDDTVGKYVCSHV